MAVREPALECDGASTRLIAMVLFTRLIAIAPVNI
jgi:hypothetical protein